MVRAILLAFLLFVGCGGSGSDLLDIIDVIDGVDRKAIDTSRLGVNAFANQNFAGSICAQYTEIRDTLRLNSVRVLFNWDDNVQPSPNASLNFSFYDDILECIPDGVDALVILTNVPSWMGNSANWINGNPRLTFARRWARRVAQRYQGNSKIIGYQIWNEPDNPDFGENGIIDVLNSPENFIELVSLSSNLIRNNDPGKLIVSGSTRSIAQNFPSNLDYNKALRDGGIEEFVDVYGIHYYGRSFERFILDVKGFLKAIQKPIWVTESGIVGVNEQLPYGEQVWPFLRENVAGIDRIYQYRFAEDQPSSISFGLRTPDPGFPVSDLYIFLRDR